MRSLTYLVAASLDGFIAMPDGSFDVFVPGPAYIAAIVEHYPETLPAAAREALGVTAAPRRFDTVVEGRRSYQTGLDVGVTDAYPHLRHVVFSRTVDQQPGSEVEIHAGDPVARVRQLKAEDGLGIWLVGGAALASTLVAEIDELVVKINPIILGDGIPMFRPGTGPRPLTHRSSLVLDDGAVFATYGCGADVN